MKLNGLIQKIDSDLSSNDRLHEACINIANSIVGCKADSCSYLTYSALARRSSMKLTVREIVFVGQYLSGDSARLFTIHFEYDDGIYSFHLDDEGYINVFESDFVVEPCSGTLLKDARQHTRPFFSLNEEVY